MEIRDLSAVRVSLASPDQIRAWSYGEVTKPETINYRRLRPERDGLFDERIFGPTRDWECYCGKYKKVRYKGVVCEKCGVEVAPARVRRERMGHIELAAPVAHVWYTRRVPSYLGLLLDVTRRNLDRVLYFAQYMITHVDEGARQKALHRLEEELKHKIERETKALQDKIDSKQLQFEDDLEKLEKKTEAAIAKLEDQLNAQTDEIVGTGKVVERKLEDTGREVRKAIVFEPTNTVIVDEGEEVASKHKKKLRDIIENRIAELEKEIRQKQKDKKLLFQAERDQKKHALEEELATLEEQRDSKINSLTAAYEPRFDELKSLQEKEFLGENRYHELQEHWGGVFKAAMGSEAVYEILKRVDLDVMARELRHEIRGTRSKQLRKKAIKRLRIVESLRKANNRPEWMILTILPVIPPDLRPMVQLDGGRFATSDLNDLYRRVINRNNRLKRLLELGAPDVIVNNEKRMLQEAVDSLIDNSQKGKAVSSRGQRKLKSLSDLLKGKQGRFRRNLLGKRVDYSGRSVIVVGPHLKLHQCGLPKSMALELFKPFVMRKLVEYNYAHNIKSAKRLVDRSSSEVWDVLEEIIKDHPVLLNRAPTLHRLGIQAFEVILVEGSAIQIHPLVCAAFNADFDGDQMAVHVPLGPNAKREARELMLASKNLLKPSSGEPIVEPTKDMVLGVYYLTMDKAGEKGEGKIFSSVDEVELAYDLGHVELHAKIKLPVEVTKGARKKIELVETTVGRVLFNQIMPPGFRFVNDALDKKKLKELVAEVYAKLGSENTAEIVDRIKEIGFKYATRSGLTIAIDDITVPPEKYVILDRVSAEVNEVEQQYRRGLITDEEQYVKTVELWTEATEQVTEAVAKGMRESSPIRVMANSGATKGGFQPIRQLAGMRGLMADPAGRIIALPIKSNFREGLTALEYFISTHGARKGLADTALRTADAGYLTRRLVDVTQEIIITQEDCGTPQGVWLDSGSKERTGEPIAERVIGRVAAKNIVHPKTGEIIISTGDLVDEDSWKIAENAKIDRAYMRSPLTCESRHGLCAKCYGRDLARGTLIAMGEAVGVIAAQSIGEPGTQLTLRTFHTGGVAGVEDITHGLPRVEELFEARDPKGEALMADEDGTVRIVAENGQRLLKIVSTHVQRDEYAVPPRTRVLVKDGEKIDDGTLLFKGKNGIDVVAPKGGEVIRENGHVVIKYNKKEESVNELPATARLRVEDGQKVHAGDQLTEGSLNPHRLLNVLGREAAQMYLVEEVQRVYRSQGVNIHDKHIEMILRQMFRLVRVKSTGDTDLLPGQLVDRLSFEDINSTITERGGVAATGQPVLLGVTKASLNTESFLSASSFQHTITVLSDAAISGKRDNLYGLKENVIIGKLIPAGTGFRSRKSADLMDSLGLAGRRGHRLNEDIRLEDEEMAEAEEFEEMLVTKGDSEAEAEEELEGAVSIGASEETEGDEVDETEPEEETEATEGDSLQLDEPVEEDWSLEDKDDEDEDEDDEDEDEDEE
ncbi:MAG: DNA-directed RNA polymerase subunit beta' [Chloroflexi bacterium]|nr:DNA-directed RNA polymerase subunit beta' [Chloroflexota bacterium]